MHAASVLRCCPGDQDKDVLVTNILYEIVFVVDPHLRVVNVSCATASTIFSGVAEAPESSARASEEE